MDTAIELINNFVKYTSEISGKLNKIDDFNHSHSVSAAENCTTIGVVKVEELEDICGFFLATVEIESADIKFILNYGDIDYGLSCTILVNNQTYSFNSYTHATLDKVFKMPYSIRSIEKMDTYLDDFYAIAKKSYPLFMENKELCLKKMDDYAIVERAKEQAEFKRSTALTKIRKANIHYIEQEYLEAYEIYSNNQEYLTPDEVLKLEDCKNYI